MSQPKPPQKWGKRLTIGLCIALTPALLTAAALVAFSGRAEASSHREAPAISKDAFADNTDTWTFISPADKNNIVFAASWIPFEAPEGGPNYAEWDANALYDIYVDTDGDALANVTYTLSSRVDTVNPNTFLYNVSKIDSISDPDWNRPQFYTLTETTSEGAVNLLVANKRTAPNNIGSKSTPDYNTLENQAIYDSADGLPAGVKVYAGPTDDAFWVDLQVFDLLTLRGQPGNATNTGVGYSVGNNVPIDSLSGFNVHSLVIEIPITRIKKTDSVFGVWSGTRRPATRVLNGAPLGTQSNTGKYVQVSRLGLPLVNEVVIPLALKDAFNSIPPDADVKIYTDVFGPALGDLLQKSVEDPEVGRLLCGLYQVPLPAAGGDCSTEVNVSTPRSGRGDIFDIYLTGMVLHNPFTIHTKTGDQTLPTGFNVNRPSNPAINIAGVVTGVVPAEMIRINTAISGDTCSPTPSRLGILGGDACGFPNGRRLGDDVVDISLLAVAGAAYEVLDDRDAAFHFTPALIGVLDDGLDRNDVGFRTTFPYMAQAQSGQEHLHMNPLLKLVLPFLKGVQISFDNVPGGRPMAAGATSLALVALVAPAMIFMRRRKNGRD